MATIKELLAQTPDTRPLRISRMSWGSFKRYIDVNDYSEVGKPSKRRVRTDYMGRDVPPDSLDGDDWYLVPGVKTVTVTEEKLTLSFYAAFANAASIRYEQQKAGQKVDDFASLVERELFKLLGF